VLTWSSDARSLAYVERRLAEGRPKPKIMRVLERYVARSVYRRAYHATDATLERRIWVPTCPATQRLSDSDLPAAARSSVTSGSVANMARSRRSISSGTAGRSATVASVADGPTSRRQATIDRLNHRSARR